MNIRITTLDLIRSLNQKKVFDELIQNQFSLTNENINNYQNLKFEEILNFHYKNNKTYKDFVTKKGFVLKNSFDLEDIPIITKNELKSNGIILDKYTHTLKHTGGTTGTPMSYALSKDAVSHLWPNLWRAFNVLNINPCDNIAMIAGPSLYNNRSIKRLVYDYISNFEVISAFDLNNNTLNHAYNLIKKNKIKAIYGYTSSIYVFLQFLKNNNYKLDLNGIFTTSETFIPAVRKLAYKYCNCDVIDIYGANDGGISSFECNHHEGYHIGSERCKIELIDKKIITTDLLNKATPFIRYEVGDMCVSNKIITEKCSCGRNLFRLEGISGRINSFIEDINGNKVHTEFFSHLFYGDENIIQFQIKNYKNEFIINIVGIKNNIDTTKYSLLIKKRFSKNFNLEFNAEIIKLDNYKTPLLINL